MGIVIALGDLHGQLGTLTRLRRVQAQFPEAVTVLIGDYIDCFGVNQGFDLIEDIRAMQLAEPSRTVVLMGNHEQAAVDFFDDAQRRDWLQFGGDNTLQSVATSLGASNGITQDRQLVLDRKHELLDWMRALPLTYTVGKLCFVHAGLNLALENPIRDSSDDDRLWARDDYWYAGSPRHIFGRNPLATSIITGHTANGWIAGKYAGSLGSDVPDDKIKSTDNSIYAIRYPGEFPRYLMDGGAGGGDPQVLGNIGIFDSDTGMLIDKVED
ncbi:metallophosphoesterase [Levilactobacillus enshiensis]|uniref:metallophosphoesterase n=1 Tax=Levilactobacillus enshiensis TaxID=2590213 RepID=UPI00117A595A|nr:metallophosphoesterase [Levilactobacillus enshiensis]